MNPPLAFAQGIVVNKHGKRFCNEMVYGATLGDAMCEDNEGKAYLILSAELFTESKMQANKALPFQRDMAKMLMYFNAKKKTDLEDIAKVYDLPAENLISEIKNIMRQLIQAILVNLVRLQQMLSFLRVHFTLWIFLSIQNLHH